MHLREWSVYDLLGWLQDANWPVFESVLSVVASNQNIAMPYVKDILQGNEIMWRYWIIDQLIPLLSDENKLLLKNDLLRISAFEEEDEDTLAIVEVSKTCLDMYYT